MNRTIWAAATVLAAVISVGCKSDNKGGIERHDMKHSAVPAAQPAAPVVAVPAVEAPAVVVPAAPVVAAPVVAAPALSPEDKAAISDAQAAIAQASGTYAKFGFPMKTDASSTVPVSTVLRDIEQYDGKTLRVSGDIDKVCEKKGCWLSMKDAESKRSMMVKFTCPVDGRLIPMAAVGKPVVVEGKVISKEITEEYARYVAEEAGMSKEDAEKTIVGPQKQYLIQSPGAQVAM